MVAYRKLLLPSPAASCSTSSGSSGSTLLHLFNYQQASGKGKIPQLLKTPAKVNLSVRTLTQA